MCVLEIESIVFLHCTKLTHVQIHIAVTSRLFENFSCHIELQMIPIPLIFVVEVVMYMDGIILKYHLKYNGTPIGTGKQRIQSFRQTIFSEK